MYLILSGDDETKTHDPRGTPRDEKGSKEGEN
jgi:hypothetical protein